MTKQDGLVGRVSLFSAQLQTLFIDVLHAYSNLFLNLWHVRQMFLKLEMFDLNLWSNRIGRKDSLENFTEYLSFNNYFHISSFVCRITSLHIINHYAWSSIVNYIRLLNSMSREDVTRKNSLDNFIEHLSFITYYFHISSFVQYIFCITSSHIINQCVQSSIKFDHINFFFKILWEGRM